MFSVFGPCTVCDAFIGIWFLGMNKGRHRRVRAVREPPEKRIRFGPVPSEQVGLSSESVNHKGYVAVGNRRRLNIKERMGMVLWSVLLWTCTDSARAPLRAPEPPQVLTQECGGLRVQVTLGRRYQSAFVADVFITDAAGQMPSGISRIVLAFTRRTQVDTTTTLVARLRESGHYTPISEFPLTPGSWIVEVIVRRDDGMAVRCLFSFDV